MYIQVETHYHKELENAAYQNDTGELLFPTGILHEECEQRAMAIDADIRASLIDLKRKIFHADEFMAAVVDYTLSVQYLRVHEDDAYAEERVYLAQLRLYAIMKDYDMTR